jgi:iron complex transport system ATP-binding protein
MTTPDGEVVGVHGVSVMRSGNLLLAGIDWRVGRGERWVLLGPNGSGKTTLVSVAATYLWPSRGSVSVLGRAVGTVDVRELRMRIGLVSASLEARVPPGLTARDVVVAGATGAIAPWWDRPGRAIVDRAAEMLELVGCATLGERNFELLSSGERQRVQIARALMPNPALLLLDEPAAGLDLGGREQLAGLLARLNAEPGLAATVVVTHHVEEIAPGTTHALILRAGRVVAAGPVSETVSSAILSEAFGLALGVTRVGDRFAARATGPAT